MTRQGIRFYVGPANALAVELHPAENPRGWVMRLVDPTTGKAACDWFRVEANQLKAGRIAFTHALEDLDIILPS